VSSLPPVTGPDGRQLGIAEYGDPTGQPVFFLHGTPGSRLRRPPNEDDVRAAGIRLLMYDRPGYGQSDRHPGRRIVDCVPDVEAIADTLGLEQFHVVGGSGGGPHALAVAARLEERAAGARAGRKHLGEDGRPQTPPTADAQETAVCTARTVTGKPEPIPRAAKDGLDGA